MSRINHRQGDQFPTISVLVTAPDTLAGQIYRGVVPLLGMTFDNRPTQKAHISAVIAAAFGGDTLAAGVTCELLADTTKADYASGFDPRKTPLGAISFELTFASDFAGMTDVPLTFYVAGVASDAPADADIVLPVITPNVTDITLLDYQGGTLPNGFYSVAMAGGGGSGTPGSVWRNGSGAPSNTLGIDGDYYLDDDAGDVYLRAAGTYSVVANIKGATGEKGEQGDPGSGGGGSVDIRDVWLFA